jgi:cyclin-dependent kinase
MKEIDGFTELCVIGEGAFGKVYKAVDKNNKLVAVKYIKFEGEEEGIPSSALREISLLKALKEHPNIVPLVDVMYKPSQQLLKIVFDYYDYDLKKFITSKDYKIDEEKIKVILKKILNGVAYIHSRRVLHRDLKPQNILIDHNGRI